jgi:hypothetical protein
MRHAKAETRTQRVRPLPRSRGGSQSPSPRTRRKSRGQRREPASTGARSRELGKQTSDERIGGACPAARCKARRRERCLARRKPVPGRRAFLTTRVGGEKAKTVRPFPALAKSRFSRGDGTRGLRGPRGSRSRTRPNHGVRRLGLYAPRPVTRPEETEVLGPRVNPRAYREVRAPAADRPAGAESAVPEGDSRDVRGRIGLRRRLHQPAKTGDGGQHPRKGREALHAATGGPHHQYEDCSSPVGCATTIRPKLGRAKSNPNHLQSQPARTALGCFEVAPRPYDVA